MVVNNIKVFARLKQEHKLNEKWFEIIKTNEKYEDIIFYKPGKEEPHRASKFRFHEVFDYEKNQRQIFDIVAKPVIGSVLQGFNGTIFAYGQTGSGKTYTMTGSSKKFEERGIIPRSLQHIFSAIEKTQEKPTLYISYMEIYNEVCYDLLSPRNNKTASTLEELPRVIILEDKKGEAHLRNLSVLPVSTEEDAMRLLFLGDTNRAIAETPLNEYSSRSHCIFTVYVTSRPNDGQSMTYSKLNLVDLAGSERVHKSNLTGNILNEAKHINLSLHFLQQVILALSESKRTHIPYRNSLMTFILKDSLAGNCLSVMLATLAVSQKNIQETISTCKFAQRVSLIKTDPVINEVSDPHQEIRLLKNEVQDLQKELARMKSNLLLQEMAPLTTKQLEIIKIKLDAYLNSSDNKFNGDIALDQVQHCFAVLKNKIKLLENRLKENGNKISPANTLDTDKKIYSENINNSQTNDISITSLNKEKILQQNSSEVNCYSKLLSCTYEKAKLFASTIEECQVTIKHLKEKLDVLSTTADYQNKCLISKELEYQQRIYRNSLIELKELKSETLQLEAGLAQAKVKVLRQLENQEERRKSSRINREPKGIKNTNAHDFYSPHYNNDTSRTCCILCKSLDGHQFCCDDDIRPYSFEKCHQLPLVNNISLQSFDFDRTKLSSHWNKSNNNCNDSAQICFCTTEIESQSHLHASESQVKTAQCFHCPANIPKTKYVEHNKKKYAQDCVVDNLCPLPINNLIDQCHWSNESLYVVSPIHQTESSNHYTHMSKKQIIKCQCKNYSPTHLHLNDQSYDQVRYDPHNFKMSNEYPLCSLDTETESISNMANEKRRNCCCDLKYDIAEELNDVKLPRPRRFINSEIQLIPDKLVPDQLCSIGSSIQVNTHNIHSPKRQECDNNIERKTFLPVIVNENRYDLTQTIKKDTKQHEENISVSSLETGLAKKLNSENEIFFDTDTEEFRTFISTVSLTGDQEVDREICNFYRTKLFP